MRTMLMAGVLATAVAVACGGGGGSAGGPPAASPPAPAVAAASPPAAEGVRVHDIRGRIAAIGGDHRTVTLDAEAIPGVMPAMKMEYQVQDPVVLEGLSTGDGVQGQMEVRPGDQYVIIRLRK